MIPPQKNYQSRLQFNAQPNSAHPTITQDPITSTYNTHLKSKSKLHDFTDFADGGLSTPWDLMERLMKTGEEFYHFVIEMISITDVAEEKKMSWRMGKLRGWAPNTDRRKLMESDFTILIRVSFIKERNLPSTWVWFGEVRKSLEGWKIWQISMEPRHLVR